MIIKSVDDLNPNNNYYLSLLPKCRTYKVTYVGCVKENYGCNFYFKFLEGKASKNCISFYNMDEIGIGDTKEEAKESYGIIKHELPKIHLDSESKVPGLENHPSNWF